MRRSLRTVLLFVPLCAVGLVAYRSYQARQQQDAELRLFEVAVKEGRAANPLAIVNRFGLERGRELVLKSSQSSPDIVFDGSDRWAQVLRVPHAAGKGQGDGYQFASLTHGGSVYNFTLPRAAVIQAISLNDDGLTLRMHGEINEGMYHFTIPKDDPAEYTIKWQPGSPSPPLQSRNQLWDYLVETYDKDSPAGRLP